MALKKILLIVFTLLAATPGGAFGQADAPEPPLTVFAAASLSGVLDEAVALYTQSSGQPVQFNYASSSALARQIMEGAPADLYISANTLWMQKVLDKGGIDQASRCVLLTNRLVLIAAPGISTPVRLAPDFDFADAFQGRLAVGNPQHVPAGMYARQALTNLGWWTALEPRLAPAADVKAALRLVELGQAAFGVVYRTDALGSGSVRIAATFPESLHEPILYEAAIVTGAKSHAGELLDFLKTSAASEVFARHGFEPVAAAPPAGLPTPESHATHPRPESSPVLKAMALSARVATGCILVILMPGLACGWWLARKSFRGKWLAEALVNIPLVLPPVVTGYLALLALGRRSLIGSWLESTFGWSLSFNWTGAVVASAIMGFPLLVRSVRIAVELMDTHLEGAASTLGASPARIFMTVSLPLIAPGLIGGLALAFARSLGEFGATITFAGNIEGQTRTLSLAIYSLMHTPGGDSAAARLIVFSLILSIGALGLSEYFASRLKRRARSEATPC